MLKHSSSSVLSGYVNPSMLKQSKPLSIPLSVSSSSNSINQPKTIISNDSSSGYLSSIKYAQDAGGYHSYQEVTSKAKSINEEIKIITNSILKIGQHKVNVFNAGNDLCKKMAQHYLHEAEYNNCAYQESRDEWRAKGNHYLASNIYDIMKDSDILPAWGVPYLTPLPLEEDPEMIAQLRAQLEQIILEMEQRDTTIEQQANDLITKNNIIGERDNTILELQTENHDLTDRLTVSEEKYALSEAKVIPLEKEVADLKHYNEILEADRKGLEIDKIELREDKKMLVDDKKMLQKEKELLLKEKDSFFVDKKGWQDLISIRENELVELKHIHFDTEHCTIVGHCNNPDHEVI